MGRSGSGGEEPETDGRTALRIFELEEDHVPARDERLAKGKQNIRKPLVASHKPNAILEVKDSKKIGSDSHDIRGRPVIYIFSNSAVPFLLFCYLYAFPSLLHLSTSPHLL